jgi:small subunit ribosomal protein S1
MDNPWDSFAATYPVGTKVTGAVKNITEFGLFIGLENDVDGMVHMSDLDWNLSGEEALAGFTKNQDVEAVVLDIDVEKERISLGIKQLESDPMEGISKLKRGDTATCTVTAVNDGGLEVSVGESEFSAFIRRSDLSRDREDQRPERFAVGDKLDAMITNFDSKSRRIGLSIKALEIAEEKEAVAQYGSVSSGASLGDILGEALNKNTDAETDAEEVVEETPAEEVAAEEVAEETTPEETPEAEAEAEAADDASDETSDESGDDSA